jgi:hypothetical protein
VSIDAFTTLFAEVVFSDGIAIGAGVRWKHELDAHLNTLLREWPIHRTHGAPALLQRFSEDVSSLVRG